MKYECNLCPKCNHEVRMHKKHKSRYGDPICTTKSCMCNYRPVRKRNFECFDCFFSCDTFDGMIIHRKGYGIKEHKMSHYDKSYKYAVRNLIKTPSTRTDILAS